MSNALGGNITTHDGIPVTGNCTVVRLDLALSASAPPKLTSSTVIGPASRGGPNKAALILAPTGLALSGNGTLYVDDTLTNSRIGHPQRAHPDQRRHGGRIDPLGGRRAERPARHDAGAQRRPDRGQRQ